MGSVHGQSCEALGPCWIQSLVLDDGDLACCACTHIGLCLQEAKLLDAKSHNSMYFIEYTVTTPAQ